VDLSVDPGSLFLILVPSVILSATLALVLLWTSSFERRLADRSFELRGQRMPRRRSQATPATNCVLPTR
jgi:hypothetical protein